MKPSDEQIKAAAETHLTMTGAAASLQIQFNTFKSRATDLGVYAPNKGGKGTNKIKKANVGKLDLYEILAGLHPQYQTYKLKHRLFKEGIKQNVCECCGVSDWLGSPIACELDHINGDSSDHRLSNLRILCPNCHSQTDTFRARNINRTIH